MINPLPLITSLFKHFTTPNKVVIDIGDIHSYIDNEKYPNELYEFRFPYAYKLPVLEKEGWMVVVGRDRYKKPIHYYDKNFELLLVCRLKNTK